jgi:Ricin-type beta-trefoil lectin domain-like/Peptidase inhibitor family I36
MDRIRSVLLVATLQAFGGCVATDAELAGAVEEGDAGTEDESYEDEQDGSSGVDIGKQTQAVISSCERCLCGEVVDNIDSYNYVSDPVVKWNEIRNNCSGRCGPIEYKFPWSPVVIAFKCDEYNAPPAAMAGPHVCLYEHANWQGQRVCVKPGTYGTFPVEGWNDRVSSVIAYNGASITMYEHGGFAGRTATTGDRITNLGTQFGLNDEISCFKVSAPAYATGPLSDPMVMRNGHGDFLDILGPLERQFDSGRQIVTYHGTGSIQQKWRIRRFSKPGSVGWQIRNEKSKKCLDVAGGAGARVVQSTCMGGTAGST